MTEKQTSGNVEKMIETHILEVDPSTGLDIRYIPVRVPEENANQYPQIVYHNLAK